MTKEEKPSGIASAAEHLGGELFGILVVLYNIAVIRLVWNWSMAPYLGLKPISFGVVIAVCSLLKYLVLGEHLADIKASRRVGYALIGMKLPSYFYENLIATAETTIILVIAYACKYFGVL